MKKKLIIGSAVGAAICCFSFLFLVGFTTPPIEKISVDESGSGLALVGGEFSHADTMYIDHRPTLQNKGAIRCLDGNGKRVASP